MKIYENWETPSDTGRLVRSKTLSSKTPSLNRLKTISP